MPKAFGTEQDITASVSSPNLSIGSSGNVVGATLLSVGAQLGQSRGTSGPSYTAKLDKSAGEYLKRGLDAVDKTSMTPAEHAIFTKKFTKEAFDNFGAAKGKSIVDSFTSLSGVSEEVDPQGNKASFNKFTQEWTSPDVGTTHENQMDDDSGTIAGGLPNVSTAAETLVALVQQHGVTVNADDVSSINRDLSSAIKTSTRYLDTANSMNSPDAKAKASKVAQNKIVSSFVNVFDNLKDNKSFQEAYKAPGGAQAITTFINSYVTDMYDMLEEKNGYGIMNVSRSDFKGLVGVTAQSITDFYKAAGTANAEWSNNAAKMAIETMQNEDLIDLIGKNPEIKSILLNSKTMSEVAAFYTAIEKMVNLSANDPTGYIAKSVDSLTKSIGGHIQYTADVGRLSEIIVDSTGAAANAIAILTRVMRNGGGEGADIVKLYLQQHRSLLTAPDIGGYTDATVDRLIMEAEKGKKLWESSVRGMGKTEEDMSSARATVETISGTEGLLYKALRKLESFIATMPDKKPEEEKEQK